MRFGSKSFWLRPCGVRSTVELETFLAERVRDLMAIALLFNLAASRYRGVEWMLPLRFAMVDVAMIIMYTPDAGASALRITAVSGERR